MPSYGSEFSRFVPLFLARPKGQPRMSFIPQNTRLKQDQNGLLNLKCPLTRPDASTEFSFRSFPWGETAGREFLEVDRKPAKSFFNELHRRERSEKKGLMLLVFNEDERKLTQRPTENSLNRLKLHEKFLQNFFFRQIPYLFWKLETLNNAL